MGSQSSILGWRIPWTEEPGRLQSIGTQRDRPNWSNPTVACTHAEVFLIVTTWWGGGGEQHSWHLVGTSQRCCYTRYNAQTRSPTTESGFTMILVLLYDHTDLGRLGAQTQHSAFSLRFPYKSSWCWRLLITHPALLGVHLVLEVYYRAFWQPGYKDVR